MWLTLAWPRFDRACHIHGILAPTAPRAPSTSMLSPSSSSTELVTPAYQPAQAHADAIAGTELSNSAVSVQLRPGERGGEGGEGVEAEVLLHRPGRQAGPCLATSPAGGWPGRLDLQETGQQDQEDLLQA